MVLNRQHYMLGGLALVGVWALWLTLGGDTPLVGGGGRSLQAREVAGDLPPVIRLTDLEHPAVAFNPSGGRNLFSYAEARPTAVSGPQVGGRRQAGKPKPRPKAPATTKKAAAVPALPQKIESAQPKPPTVNFKFVGYLGPQSALIGVFKVSTPDGEEVVLAAEGEILAENFRVYRIGYEDVEIGYTQEPFLNERKVLPMGGQS